MSYLDIIPPKINTQIISQLPHQKLLDLIQSYPSMEVLISREIIRRQTDIIDSCGSQCLQKAIDHSNYNLISKLIHGGVDLNPESLFTAIYKGDTILARILLDNGADPNFLLDDTVIDNYTKIIFHNYTTPIMKAYQIGNTNMVQLLEQYGGDLDANLRLIRTKPVSNKLSPEEIKYYTDVGVLVPEDLEN